MTLPDEIERKLQEVVSHRFPTKRTQELICDDFRPLLAEVYLAGWEASREAAARTICAHCDNNVPYNTERGCHVQPGYVSLHCYAHAIRQLQPPKEPTGGTR